MGNINTNNKVIIYCRVSSRKQVNDGNGLDSQEQACRAWARARGLTVERVFAEKGISGSTSDRPELTNMLRFLASSNNKYTIVALDINRFARDTGVYATLKAQLAKHGHSMQTVNMHLDETHESDLLQNVSTALGQYERLKNRDRTIKCMEEHLKQGYWVLRPALGYREKRIHGKIHHIHKEPDATYIKEALEGFASCRFMTQKDVLNFLQDKNLTTIGDKPITPTLNIVKNMLTNELYTSYFAYKTKNWNIPYQKWHIEPIISRETYQAIQNRLNPKKTIQPRKYNRDDESFPLRRFVRCATCGAKMTASKPASKSGKRHMYYHCYNKQCPMHCKSIRQADMHAEFERVLQIITPTPRMLHVVDMLIQRLYNTCTADYRNNRANIQAQIAALTQDKDKAFDLLMKSQNNPNVANMCTERISRYAEEIDQLQSQLDTSTEQPAPIGEAKDYVMRFLRNPLRIWQTGNYADKQGVLNLCFAEQISYDLDKKFRTPKLSPIFAVFNDNLRDSESWRTQKDSNSQPSDP